MYRGPSIAGVQSRMSMWFALVVAFVGLHAAREIAKTGLTFPPPGPADPALLGEWLESYARFQQTITYPTGLWCVAGGIAVGLAYFLSVLLHELGHLVVARLVGWEVAALELSFLGGFVEFADDDQLTAGRLALMAVAGPFVNLVLCAAAGMTLLVSSWPVGDSIAAQTSADVVAERVLVSLFVINGLALLINLLPLRALDGGQLMNAIRLWSARRR